MYPSGLAPSPASEKVANWLELCVSRVATGLKRNGSLGRGWIVRAIVSLGSESAGSEQCVAIMKTAWLIQMLVSDVKGGNVTIYASY